jgi:hypothetical protein
MITASISPSAPPMKLAILPVTAYQQNCSLVVCDKTQRAALVDRRQ